MFWRGSFVLKILVAQLVFKDFWKIFPIFFLMKLWFLLVFLEKLFSFVLLSKTKEMLFSFYRLIFETKIKFMKCMLSSLIASSLFCILNTQVPYKQVRWSLYSLKHNITIYGFTCIVNTVLILPFDNVSRKRYSMCLTVTYLLFRIIIHRIAVYKYKAFL